MKRFRTLPTVRLLLLMAAFLFALPLQALSNTSATPTTTILSSDLSHFISGQRLRISAVVKDRNGITTVRCYFKGAKSADFVYVVMEPVGGLNFEGILPAPTAESIEYVILAVNNKGQVARTPIIEIKKDDQKKAGVWQQVSSQGDVQVSTELPQAPQNLSGFRDAVIIEVVPSGERFGRIAGLYGLAAKKATSNTKGKAYVGIVSEGEDNDTLLLVGGALAAVAAIGGIAAAAGGGGGGGGTSPPANTTDVTDTNVDICVLDPNTVQDDFYDLFVNDVFIGAVNLPPGGDVCYAATLESGENQVELRLTVTQGSGTFLTINIDPGGWTRTFQNTTNHSWTITAP